MLREALMLLPNENYIYYADSDNASMEQNQGGSKETHFDAVKFLMKEK